jgi:hypothetical protein
MVLSNPIPAAALSLTSASGMAQFSANQFNYQLWTLLTALSTLSSGNELRMLAGSS